MSYEDAEVKTSTGAIRAKQNIVFCVLILLSNSLVIVTIFSSPVLRKLTKFHSVVSTCVCSMMSSLYLVMDSASALGALDTSTGLAAVVSAFHLYTVPSIITSTLLFVCLDFCIFRMYGAVASQYISSTHISLWVPWSYGLVALVLLPLASPPLVGESHATWRSESYYQEPFLVKDQLAPPHHFTWPLMIGWVCIPTVLSLAIMYLAVVIYCRYSETSLMSCVVCSNTGLVYSPNVLDASVSLVVFSCLNIRFYIDLMTERPCTVKGSECWPRNTMARHSELARWSVFFLMPVLCQLDRYFRQESALLCAKIFFGGS